MFTLHNPARKRPLNEPVFADEQGQPSPKRARTDARSPSITLQSATIQKATDKLRAYVSEKTAKSEFPQIKTFEEFTAQNLGFHHVITQLDTHPIKWLLAMNVPVDQQNSFGDSALMVACKIQFAKGVEALMSVGANVHLANNKGKSPLELMAKYELVSSDTIIHHLKTFPPDLFFNRARQILHASANPSVVNFIIKKGIPADSLNHHGLTPFFHALKNSNLILAASLLQEGANPNQQKPIQFLARRGCIESLEFLHSRNVDLFFTDQNGNCLLMDYCMSFADKVPKRQIVETIHRFIKFGFSVTRKNHFGESPIEVIAKNKLISEDALLNLIENLSEQQLSTISQIIHHVNSPKLLKFLVSKNISPDSYDSCGRTPLLKAVYNLNAQLVYDLLECGANPRLLSRGDKFSAGQSPLDVISSRRQMIQRTIDACQESHKPYAKMQRENLLRFQLRICMLIQNLLAPELAEPYESSSCSGESTDEYTGSL